MFEDLPQFKFILSDAEETWDLPQAPDGWEESFLSWERSLERAGIIRKFSIPLKWVLDGAYYLRKRYYSKNGVQSVTRVDILKLNPKTLQYLPYYTGAIDYSTFIDEPNSVLCGIMDSGLDERSKSHGATLLEIPLTGDPDTVTVTFQGIELRESGLATVTGVEATGPAKVPNIDVQIKEQKVSTESLKGVSEYGYGDFNRPYTNPDDDHYFYKNTIDSTLHITGKLEGRVYNPEDVVGPAIEYKICIRIENRNEYDIGRATIPASNGQPVEQPFSFNVDLTLNVSAGERVWLYAEPVLLPLGVIGFVDFNGNTLEVNYNVFTAPSTALAMPAAILFERIMRKIGGLKDRTRSALLAAPPFNSIYYTSGTALRGIEPCSIKISLNNFLNDWQAIACAGMGIEQEIAVLEGKDYFFRKAQKIGTLKAVKYAAFETAEKFMYNTIKTGSPDQNTDELNGREEVNSEQTWTAPFTRIIQEYNILTASRADAYGIEFTRINLEGKKTTDSASDNDTFILDVVPDGAGAYKMALLADRYLSATGITAADSIYNLWLSPKQNLLRHNYWLASAAWGMEQYYINFQAALKNAELVTVDLTGKRVAEKENILITTLGPKIYYPIIATVRAIYDKNLWELINNTPYGYLEFMWEDSLYNGYIIEASIGSISSQDKEFKLLLTSGNNLLNLIK